MAAVAARGRAVAFAFVAILALSALPAVVPTAEAAPAPVITKPTVTVDGTPAATTPAIFGSSIAVSVDVTPGASPACPTGTTATVSSVTLTSDALGKANTSLVKQTGNTWTLSFNVAAPVGAPVTSTAIVVDAAVQCQLTGGTQAPADVTAWGHSVPSDSFTVDNVRPTGTATITVNPAGRINATLSISLSSLTDTARATADLRPIGGVADQPLSLSTANAFTINPSTAPAGAQVSVTLWDNANPVAKQNSVEAVYNPARPTIDATRPTTVASLSLLARPDNVLDVTFARPSEVTDASPADIPASGYFITLKNTTSSQMEVRQANQTNATFVGGTRTAGVTYLTYRLTFTVNSGFGPGTTYQVTVNATDNSGNAGFPFEPRPSALVTALPTDIAFTSTPLYGTKFDNDAANPGTITGSYTTTSAVASGSSTLVMWLSRTVGANTEYWQGDNPATFASTRPSTTPASLQVTNTQSPGNPNAGTFTATAPPASAIPDGLYTLGIDFAPNGQIVTGKQFTINLDKTTPAGSAAFNMAPLPSAGIGQGAPITVKLDYTDTGGTGLAGFEFRLYNGTGANALPAWTVANVPMPAIVCPATGPCTAVSGAAGASSVTPWATGSAATSYHANATLWFPSGIVQPQGYTLRVIARDLAGNAKGAAPSGAQGDVVAGSNVTLVPRVLFGAASPPSVDQDGKVYWTVYAEIDSANASDGAPRCFGTVCQVGQVQILTRRHGTTEAGTALGSANGVTATPTPAAPGTYLSGDGVPFSLFNYTSPEAGTDAAKISPSAVGSTDIRAVVTVGPWVGATPWTQLVPVTSSALSILPALDNVTFVDGRQYSVKFNVTLNKAGLDLASAPLLNYSIRVLNDSFIDATHPLGVDGSGNPIWPNDARDAPPATDCSAGHTKVGCYVRSLNDSATDNATPVYQIAPPDTSVVNVNSSVNNGGSTYYYNFTNANFATKHGPRLPAGRYLLNVSAHAPGSTTGFAYAQRVFTVEDRPATVTFPPQAYVFDNAGTGYVAKNINVDVRVTHGFAGFNPGGFASSTAIPAIDLVIQDSAGRWLRNGSGGFFTNVANVVVTQNASTLVTLNVTLPDSLAADRTFNLYANATTDAYAQAGATLAQARALLQLALDATPPATLLDTNDINGTIDTLAHGPPKVYATATDAGAGVAEVQMRIVDLNATVNGSTFLWNGSASIGGVWVSGVNDTPQAWLSSLPSRDVDGALVTNIEHVGSAASGVWFWNTAAHARSSVPAGATTTFPRVELDRNHTYLVSIRARDNVMPPGSFSEIENKTVRLDVTLPTIVTPLAMSPAATQLPWHDTDLAGTAQHHTLSVQVADNTCIARVYATGWVLVNRSGGQTFNLTLPEANMSIASGDSFPVGTRYGCDPTRAPDALGDEPHNFTLDLSNAPQLLDVVGDFTIFPVVVDAAGNKVAGAPIRGNVTDTQKAIVRFVAGDPPLIPAGTPSRVRAEVFENSQIAYVRAIIQTKFPSGSVCEQSSSNCVYAEGKMTPDVCPPPVDASGNPVSDPRPVAFNGTGCYVIDTNQMFRPVDGSPVGPLAVGDYLWTVRAYDAKNATTCADGSGNLACDQRVALIVVSNQAPAAIVLDRPVNGTTVVNATPSFQWRVLDPNATAAGIHVEASDINGTLVEVTPTKDALLSGGNVTGYTVTYAPGSLANFTNYTVRIRATSASGFTVSLTSNYTVDAISPTASANVTGTFTSPTTNVSYAVAGTRVAITANDSTSAVTITTSVNGAAAVPYTGPITPDGPDGLWTLAYTARDAAGNVATGTVQLTIDHAGPTINVATQGDQVAFTVTDAGVGVDDANVTVHYAYGDAASFSIAKATRSAGNLYTADLKGNATKTGLRYYLEAKDAFGNLGTKYSALQPFVINAQNGTPSNLPPKVTITAPLADSKHRGSVDLKWIANDPEELPVSVTVALREPTGSGKFLVTGGSNSGLLAVNLSALPAGPYTLVVTVSDGVSSAQDQVTFTVVSGDVVTVVTPPDQKVEPGRAVRFVVGINPIDKTVRSATYTLTLDGAPVGTGALTSAGGVWAASVSPTAPGAYAVLVSATYDDGTTEPAQQVATFTVQSAAPPSSGGLALPGSLIVLLAIAILTIALAAYGAFVRWSK